MWQTVVVLFVIAVVLIYVIRHYVRVLRGKASACCECSGCCAAESQNGCENSGELRTTGGRTQISRSNGE